MHQREYIREVRRRLYGRGYRPVTAEDIIEGAELVLVDVNDCYEYGGRFPVIGVRGTGTTVIVLDEKPLSLIDNTLSVLYHCISPKDEDEYSVPLEEILLDEFISTHSRNEMRYFANL